MAKIEKREVVPTTPPPVEYVLTLNQKELDVLETLRYFYLAGSSDVRDSLAEVLRVHGNVHSEWKMGSGVWPV